ncbi:MAG: hypothetical protein CH6_1477 [Candidatus Kapaibacterium sp.]|nr:MAG: hypothetical protein CH6_1477 [Candidatus Kapabacteria bacterium]
MYNFPFSFLLDLNELRLTQNLIFYKLNKSTKNQGLKQHFGVVNLISFNNFEY